MHTHKPTAGLTLGLLALVGGLTLTDTQPAHALSPVQGQTARLSLTALAARLDADEAKLTTLQSTVTRQAATIRTLRETSALSAHAITAAPNATTTYGPFTVTGTEVYLNGYNLHIQNGSGKTSSANGLGNLILGYGETRSGVTRTGSHNLVTGQYNSYTSYAGIIGGYNNSITGAYSSVLGGDANTASGLCAAVSGGFSNQASGNYASAVGGQGSTASATYALEPVATSVASLQSQITNQNKITSLFTLSDGAGTNTELTLANVNLHIINGMGSTNSQNGLGNLILGYNENRGGTSDVRTGSHNIVTGIENNFSSSGGILGGYYNTLNGSEEFAVGGVNTVSGSYSSVSGGYNNMIPASADFSSISGGVSNTTNDSYCCITGGVSNTTNESYSSISGGSNNITTGEYSSISGGSRNTASGVNASVSGGYQNTAGGSTDYSAATSVCGGTGRSVTTQYGWAAGSQGSSVIHGNFFSP